VANLQKAAKEDKNGEGKREGFASWVTARNQEVVNDFLRKHGFANTVLLDAFGTHHHRPPESNPKVICPSAHNSQQLGWWSIMHFSQAPFSSVVVLKWGGGGGGGGGDAKVAFLINAYILQMTLLVVQ
jgi:hypothetical protein